MTSQLHLYKSNHITIYKFLIYWYCIPVFFNDFLKTNFKIGHQMTESVPSFFQVKNKIKMTIGYTVKMFFVNITTIYFDL